MYRIDQKHMPEHNLFSPLVTQITNVYLADCGLHNSENQSHVTESVGPVRTRALEIGEFHGIHDIPQPLHNTITTDNDRKILTVGSTIRVIKKCQQPLIFLMHESLL